MSRLLLAGLALLVIGARERVAHAQDVGSRASPRSPPMPAHAHAAPDDSAALAFLEAAAAAARRYAESDVALAAGYRPLGPDFPGMGEHWIQPGLVVNGRIDPRRPPVLTYLRTPAGMRLTGVAYALPLEPGQSPPVFPFPGAWHDHTGSVDEEALALGPGGAMHEGPGGPRLAMLHVWLWPENPAGVFAQDNWAVPFARLGLVPPPEVPPNAGKALFLASGGTSYYGRLIRLRTQLTPAEAARVDVALENGRARVAALLEDNAAGVTIERLEWIWADLWAEIREGIGGSAWARIAPLAG